MNMDLIPNEQPYLDLNNEVFYDEYGFDYPITHWVNSDGDCEKEDAVICVAGVEGRWFAIEIESGNRIMNKKRIN